MHTNLSKAAGSKKELIAKTFGQTFLYAAFFIITTVKVLAESPAPGTYWEPNFPFIEASLDARAIPQLALTNNLTVRGLILPLGSNTFACFDTDLLRWSLVWHGNGIDFASMAPISYASLGKKNGVGQADLNAPIGEAISATGLYPGVGSGQQDFKDPRHTGLDPDELGLGPIPASLGRWEGIYAVGNQAVLSYTVAGTLVHEFAETCFDPAADEGYARNLEIAPHDKPLQFVVGDYPGCTNELSSSNASGRIVMLSSLGPQPRNYFVVFTTDGFSEATLTVNSSNIVTLSVRPSKKPQQVRLALFRFLYRSAEGNPNTLTAKFSMPDFSKGGSPHWPETVVTRGLLSTNNDSAYVVDRLVLPDANPWHRRVRSSSVCFCPDGRAAVVTFDGDVWMVSGIDHDLKTLTWRRIASGLSEPQSIHFYKKHFYVFTCNGIVRLWDLNGDGETDYYENFANCFAQSAETRDFPMDSIIANDGSIYISEGGQEGTYLGIDNGSVLKISRDGRSTQVVARGLREPYLGYNSKLDLLTGSDQQGNWIPTSPIQWLRDGLSYGFQPDTKIRPPVQPVTEPICWIPYRLAQSTSGQVWANSGKLGVLNGQLIQLDYFHPRLLVAFFDSLKQPVQGAVSELDAPFDYPLLKGDLNPTDGLPYLTGFRIWGSSAKEWAGFGRLRYTGKPANEPAYARSARDGLLVQFDQPLDAAFSTNIGNFNLQRWNYRRTAAYGSGHYTLKDVPGQEFVSIDGALISRDRKSLFLHVPAMAQVMQMELTYRLKRAVGDEFDGHVYFTVHQLPELNLKHYGFTPVDWSHWVAPAELLAQNNAAQVVSLEEGRHRYEIAGCIACHSTDGTTTGRAGPSFRGLFGKEVDFATGEPEIADEAYIRESILKPQAKIVKGYEKSEVSMPTYEGVLTDSQIESIILFIKSLSGPSAQN